MSLLWADDFSTYGVGGQAYMLDGLYAELGGNTAPTLVADPDPNGTGAPVLRLLGTGMSNSEGNMNRLRYALPSGETTIGFSFRIYMATLPAYATAAPLIRIGDMSNNPGLYLRVGTNGQIHVMRGWFSTEIAASAGVLTAAAWHHVEVKILFSDTVGTVDVYVNGTSVISETGLDTVNAGSAAECGNISLGMGRSASNDAGTTYYKDIVIWDTSGSVNNDVMGTCYIGRFTVSSDASFNWTASTGSTGYNLLDETGPSDADYISADATPPAASTFGLENLPTEVTSVRGIVLLGRMKKSDGGDCNVQMSVVTGGDTTNGADRAITTAYTYWKDILETNTGTGVAFTPTEFNAATFKINRTL